MSDAPLVAGILGGSGTHVVQIIIAIVVAAALIGYFLLRVGGRGGDAQAGAAAVRPTGPRPGARTRGSCERRDC